MASPSTIVQRMARNIFTGPESGFVTFGIRRSGRRQRRRSRIDKQLLRFLARRNHDPLG